MKKDPREKPLDDRKDVRSDRKDSSAKTGNPAGRDGNIHRAKRFKDCIGSGSQKRRKRTSSGGRLMRTVDLHFCSPPTTLNADAVSGRPCRAQGENISNK